MLKNIDFVNDDIKGAIKDLKSVLPLLKNKKILVTGASGHLGYNLLLVLLQANRELNLGLNVTATSRSQLRPIFTLYKNEFLFVHCDLVNENFTENFEDYDLIFHLAGYAQPTRFISDPLSTILINTEVVSLLLSKVKDNGNFLFISSSEIYTHSNLVACDEDSVGSILPSNARSVYVYAKLLGESLCIHESSKSNKKISIARLSMTYGPGIELGDSRAISSFLNQALVHNYIKLIDQGKANREYLYVIDAIGALLKITTQGKSNTYNIGAGSKGAITIRNAAEIISKLTNSEISYTTDNMNLLSARSRVDLNISRFSGEFGAIFKTDFQSGIEKTINWIKTEYNL